MSSKFLDLSGLKEFIDRQNPQDAKEFMENVAKFFDDDLTKPELELALEVFFHPRSGTLGFLNKSDKQHKIFKDSNVKIFELWSNLIHNHGNDVDFEPYLVGIIECCKKYILSTIVSAAEREKAVIVLQEIYNKKLMDNFDSKELVTKCLEIFRLKNQPATFTREICKLLGIIAKDSPENITKDNELILRDVYIKILEDILLNEESVQYNLLTGAMEGLNYYLVNFAPSLNDETNICQRIYACIKKLCGLHKFEDVIKTKAPFRTALDVFTNHSQLFSEQIFKDFIYWNECLNKWIASKIIEDHKKGLYAINIFHQVIAQNLLNLFKNQTNTNNELNKQILYELIENFRKILENPQSESYKMRIAIRGFGLLSGLCKKFLPDQLEEILILVIQRTELISFSEDNELRDILEHFPDYILSLSQTMIQINDKHITQILSHNIKNITIRLIRDFHYLSRVHTGLVINSLCHAFYNLSQIDGTLYENIMEKIVLEGVIWTCSHKLIYDVELDWEKDTDWKDNVTYKSYLPLWEGLLSEHNINSLNFPLQYDKTKISKKLFDSLLSTLFIILDKLDLRTKRRIYTDESGNDQEFYFCDPNIDLCPIRTKDFHIFINLVDFYRDLFWTKYYQREYFRNWLNEYLTKMIEFSIKNPLISGFLKLLGCGLSIADYLNYFNDSDDDSITISETNNLQSQLQYFLHNLIEKCDKCTGELQITTLELLFKFPIKFYHEYLIEMIKILKISFNLGKSMLWLAKLSISYLEKISDYFRNSYNDLKKFYSEVLPCLDSYLQSKGLLENPYYVELIPYKRSNKKRIHKGTIKKINETELLSVQKRIVTFLGKLEPQNAALIVSSYEKLSSSSSPLSNTTDVIDNENDNLVKWDTRQNIRLRLNLLNMCPIIYLDNIIPRICHLAQTSSDRKTKISACELLHSIILYVIGTRNYHGRMWKKLCKIMLELGSDNDLTVQQIFEPLLKQIMHFMSKLENISIKETIEILIDTLMEGISNINSTLRDLSATCLREFVEWSIKQTTPEQLAASPVSIKSLLLRLKMYSFDSLSTKRSGAALTFNNLYRKLREEESICDIFFIDLLYIFCINFKLSEELCSQPLIYADIGLQNSDLELVSMSLNHIVRVLKERNYLYNKVNPKRIIPKGMKIGTLLEIVQFLFNELQTKLMNYRHKCIEMIEQLILHIENIPSIIVFMKKYITIEQLHEICEGTINGIGIKARPNLNYISNIKNSLSHTLIYSWLEQFLSSLDCYCWLMNDYVLYNPEILFDETITNIQIFNVITYYFNNICWNNMYEILEKINPELLSETNETIIRIGTEEIHKIEIIKCIICIRIIDFLTQLLKCGEICISKIPKDFWKNIHKNLIKFLKQLIYEPYKLNFDYRSQNILKKLPQRIENLLKQLFQHLSNNEFIINLKNELYNEIINRLKQTTDDTKNIIINSNYIKKQKFSIIIGIEFSIKNWNLIYDNNQSSYAIMFIETSAKKLINDLFNSIKQKISNEEYIIEISPDVKKFINSLMKICFMINENIISNIVINYILDNNELQIMGTTNTIQHGEYFYNIYKKAIFEQCKTSFIENIFITFFSKMNKQNVHYIHRIIMDFLEFLYKYRKNDHECIEKCTNIILENSQKIIESLDNINEDDLFIELISELAKLTPYPLKTFKDKSIILEKWICDRLQNNKILLEQKSKTIYLLPFLIDSQDIENIKITNVLENLQRQHFPLKSSEFKCGSLEEISLKSAYKALLNALVLSKSYIILDFIIKSTAPDPKHILEWMIREELKLVINELNNEQQINWLNKILQICCNKNLEPIIRLTICKRFLKIMIENSNEESLIKFYTNNNQCIDSLINTNYSFNNTGYDVQQALVNRIIGFSLIETMCGNITKDKLKILQKYIRISYYVRTEIFFTNDKDVSELFRLYQCAAYCTICSLISNLQNTLIYYEKFLFTENPTKNEYIWQLLIDKNKCYVFKDQELENYLGFKERFVSIRKLNPSPSSSSSFIVDNQSLKMLTSAKILRTQNVFESSLSQDVSKIDFNNSLVRNDSEILIKINKNLNNKICVNLERNEINKHEIMPTICGVIKHMYENNITPIPENPKIKRLYKWISEIADTIGNSQNHKNVRILLAQIVDNCRDVFQHYAHVMFKPILEMLVDECAGSTLNFFITDLIALLLSWSSKNFHKPTNSEEIRLASSLLKFVMKNAWHERREVFKFNIELIKQMLNLWKDIISLPYQLLYDMITKTRMNNSRDNECGIILIDIIFENDLLPWTNITKYDFIKAIYYNLNNELQSIYLPAAQVFGMILKYLQNSNENNHDEIDNWKIKLQKLLQNLKNDKNIKNEKKFIDILFAIQKNYSDILDTFLEYIKFKIPKAIDIMKCLYLEMFLSRVEKCEIDGIYDVLISIGIKDLLKHYRYQIYALHIINRSLSKLKSNEINDIFKILVDCCQSKTIICRDLSYEVMIFISKNYDAELQKKANIILIKGLQDPEKEIQNRIFKYWSNESKFSSSNLIKDRILLLIENFNNECEKQFIGFCTQLLLQCAIDNPNSKRQIFEHEIDDNNESKLREYTINTTSHIKSTYTIPPLFAESQQLRRSTLSMTSSSSSNAQLYNFIRDTQNNNYFFEPTQDPNKMTQIHNTFTLPTSSSLPFLIQSQILDRRSQKLQNLNQQQQQNDDDKIFNNFRNRLLKDSKKENRTKVLKYIDYKTKKQGQMDYERKKKESQVILYRRYRYGDYPDFLIDFLTILLPLQGLVKNDPIIARQIFVSIFKAVSNELNELESKSFLTQVGEKIQIILENSRTCEPIIFATFIETALLKPQYFKLSPELISMMSKASNMLTIGAIYIENCLNSGWDDDTISSIRSSTTISNEDKHWLHLSDIYESLAEYDIVASIFADKIRTDPRLSEAIDLKSNNLYEDAQKKLYEVILNNIYIEQYYAYNCYFDCFIELGDWKQLHDSVNDQIQDFDDLWNDDYNMRFLLPKLMKSEVQLTLQGYNKSNDFLQILNEWMKDTNKCDYIKTEFCEELMMLHISNYEESQKKEARVYCENYLKTFIMEWGIISSLYDKLRLECLLNAQKVSEIDHYTYLMLENFNEKLIDILNDRWKNCIIEKNDSLKFWNTVIAYRTYIAALIVHKLENTYSEQISTSNLENTIFDMNLQFFNASIHQKNYGLCEKILDRLSPTKIKHDNRKFLQYNLSQIKKTILKGKRCKNFENSINLMEEAWIQTESILNDINTKMKNENYIHLNIDALQLNCEIGEEILNIIIEKPSIITNDITERIKNYTKISYSENILQRIFDKCIWSLNETINLTNLLLQNYDLTNEISNDIAKTNYRLAQFCYDYYDMKFIEKHDIIENLLIKCVFKSMKYESLDARQLFPCILQLPSIKNDKLYEKYEELSNDIPEWMYLIWIPQILSYLKFNKKTFIDNIIIKLSKKYPNSIIYSFNLWCDHYENEFYNEKFKLNINTTTIIRSTIIEIKNSLNNPLINKFIENIKFLCLPENLLCSYLENFDKILRKIEHNNLIQENYIKLCDKLIYSIYHSNDNNDDNDIKKGSRYRNIIKYEQILEGLKKFNIINDIQNIRIYLYTIINKLRKTIKKITKNEKILQLELLCPWLSLYQWCGEENYLELPGQYANYIKKPNIINHIKIVKFDHNIELFQSQRCPIKLKIYGSNGKLYDYLIKFGEDLKQDQRIQQLLKLMSLKLKNDEHCYKHNLFIQTFEVIPIDRYCGLISWVYNTKELHDFILEKNFNYYQKLLYEIQNSYLNFINEPIKQNNIENNYDEIKAYGKAVTTYTIDNISRNYRNLENRIDSDILKYSLINISVSPESYFILRNNFIKSLSTINIAHWILGIGDRHLKNILINYNNGTLTGIDFNCTFGTATRNLPIPELIPFRLTPHLINLMNPMGTSGFLFKCMVHALRVFRNNKKLLLACMDVFIREPTINWIENIKRTKISMDNDDSISDNSTDSGSYTDESDTASTTSNWEPKDRIDIAKCKLDGYNPMYLIERELRVGIVSNRFPEYLEGYIKVLRGNQQFNIRARLPQEDLNPEMQVKCLIDLASDPSILGITYHGFMPWM